MSFFSKLFELMRFGRKAAGSSGGSALGGILDPMGIWRNQSKLSAERAFSLYAGWVYACIRAIAEEIANMEFKLYETDKDGKRREVVEHELLDILYGVNDFQTGYEIKYLTAAHLEMVGNAFWYLEGVASDTDKPKAIHILNPKYLKVKKQGFPQTIVGYKLVAPGTTKDFEPYEILHFKYPDPVDALEGIGTVQNIVQWIDADNFATEFNRRFFMNGARLSGFLESESGYTPEQLQYLKRAFEDIYSGIENAYKVAALPKGTKFTQAGEGQKDMDFVNLQTMMRDKILAGFRVPRTVLGITDDVNRANAEATNYVFSLRTIKPKMELIVSQLNEFLVPRYGENLYLDFADPVPENRELLIKEAQAALGNQPALSVNEARERYFSGLPAVEGGDAVMKDFNKMPLGAPVKDNSPQQRDTIPKPRKVRKTKKARKEISESIAKEAIRGIAEIKLDKQGIKADTNEEEFIQIYKAFLIRVEGYEQRQIELVREVNRQQRTEVIANLTRIVKLHEAVKAINPDELYDSKKYIKLTVDLTTPNFENLASQEGAAAAQLIGYDEFIASSPEMQNALEHSIQLMAETYDETTKAYLKDKLGKALDEGAGFDELTDIVNGIYDYSDETRALTVARTETFRVANEANRDAWKQAGTVQTLKWYTAEDEMVCPYCGPMQGVVVGIDENFFEQGDTVTGSDGKELPVDYADVDTPPLHVNCRCYIRPEQIDLT